MFILSSVTGCFLYKLDASTSVWEIDPVFYQFCLFGCQLKLRIPLVSITVSTFLSFQVFNKPVQFAFWLIEHHIFEQDDLFEDLILFCTFVQFHSVIETEVLKLLTFWFCMFYSFLDTVLSNNISWKTFKLILSSYSAIRPRGHFRQLSDIGQC